MCGSRGVDRRSEKFPVRNPDRGLSGHLRDLPASGDGPTLVDRVHPWQEIVDAYRYVEKGQKIGSVVLRVVENVPLQAPTGG